MSALICARVVSSLAAQGDPQGRIAYGQTQTDFLSSISDTLQDGSYYRVFVFTGQIGDSVSVWLSSADFDPYLILTDARDNVIESDNNSGGACNAYLTSTLPQDGEYSIFASAAGGGEVGQFELTLRRGIQPPNSREPCRGYVGHAGVLTMGDVTEGRMGADDRMLSDSSLFQVWLLPETDGKPFTVDLASDDFDAALILVRGFSDVLKVDDDGAGGCDARIAYAPTDSRPLRLVVISRSKSGTGAFALRVTDGMLPTVDRPPCDRSS